MHHNLKYCPQCAGELERKMIEEKHRLVCCNCGFVFYQNPKPCTAVLVEDNGKLMLTKRGIEPFKDWWDLPGGFIEEGEHPEEGARRELLEETGIEIEIISLLGIFMDIYGTCDTHTMNMHYLARPKGGVPEPKSDIIEIRWFSPEELPENIAFDNCREGVLSWKKRKKWRKKYK